MKAEHVRRTASVLAGFLILLAAGGVTAVVSAGPLAQSSSSEEQVASTGVLLPSAQAIGDDPDEDGYAGDAAVAAVGDMAASEPAGVVGASTVLAQAEPQADEDGFDGEVAAAPAAPFAASEEGTGDAVTLEQILLEPQPDQDDGSAEAAGVDATDWSGFYYVFVAGSALMPRDSSTTWGYGGSGCVYAKAGTELLVIDLDLPHGSRVDYVRIYYYDTSASNSVVWLTSYSGCGLFTDHTSVSSSGNSGYGAQLSPLVSHVVNTAQNAYTLNWRSNQTGTSMRLCGVRVAYRLPS